MSEGISKGKNLDIIFSVMFLVLGLLLAFTPKNLAPVCAPMHDGSFMKCHWMGEAVVYLGIAIAVLALIILFVSTYLNNTGAALGLILANIVVGVFTLMTPISILGTCGNPMMDCNVHTKPMVILLSSIFIIANVVYLVLNRDKLGKK